MEEKAKDKRSTLKTVFNVLYYVVLGVVILFALTYMVLTFTTKNGVTSIFGYSLSSVQSGSMSGTFEKGDMIVVKECDPAEIQQEDVISFYYLEPNSRQKIIVTHRVIDIDGGKFIAQGDVARKNNSVDDVQYVSRGDVVGKYTGVRLPALGAVADFMRSSIGFFVCVLIPVFIFLFWQIYVFAKTVIEARSLGKEKEINDKARELAEQMMREMQSKENEPDAPSEESKE